MPAMTGNDPFEELGRELREKVGGEFRRSAEEDEFAARKAALRQRDLAQVAYELLARGDSVRVTIGSTQLRGVITHSRGNLATLTTGDSLEMHLNLSGPLLLEVVERSTAGGSSREQYGPETFVARLRELELNQAPVAIYLGFTDFQPAGVIEAVAKDHIMLVGETTNFIPLAHIGGVRRTP
jgi:hypothetical protein